MNAGLPISCYTTPVVALVESLQEFSGTYSGPRVHSQFEVADFFVNLLHEADYEVDELVLVHLLCVEVGDEKAYVITLFK